VGYEDMFEGNNDELLENTKYEDVMDTDSELEEPEAAKDAVSPEGEVDEANRKRLRSAENLSEAHETTHTEDREPPVQRARHAKVLKESMKQSIFKMQEVFKSPDVRKIIQNL
jgi:hypothetical protein